MISGDSCLYQFSESLAVLLIFMYRTQGIAKSGYTWLSSDLSELVDFTWIPTGLFYITEVRGMFV